MIAPFCALVHVILKEGFTKSYQGVQEHTTTKTAMAISLAGNLLGELVKYLFSLLHNARTRLSRLPNATGFGKTNTAL